eukprot:gnl/TRDRNA2_/TRDRNA2_185901_c0_seq1.p1 gnl/TRDRNA2_/TRDRNA2_185901_c0~~gnl/TRDRNA2_/TRDRNA2_185901_c0_seq1.p1  ORF type:complete len:676 (+),score=86.49 gnl/TRDRNA2_/TRDRNA2_185901_c0_seq1:83-2110(+)
MHFVDVQCMDGPTAPEEACSAFFSAYSSLSGDDQSSTCTGGSTSTSSPRGLGHDPRNTDLNYYHGEARILQRVSTDGFVKIKGLSDCCRQDGKVELHRYCDSGGNSSDVVVKRVLKTRVNSNKGAIANERLVHHSGHKRHSEDTLTEIAIYCYLCRQEDVPQYILKMHTAFEAGSDIWVVLEHADGGDLFSVIAQEESDTSVPSAQLMHWMWQLLRAIGYLHQHGIGHRDVSMENVLLCGGEIRLMDFGQAVQTHSPSGAPLRYFRATGKPYYRPPECYVPQEQTVHVTVPEGSRPGEVAFVRTTKGDYLCEVFLPPGAAPSHQCVAEPWGYTVPPVDIFACGVCLFIMIAKMPPWRQATMSDSHFMWAHRREDATALLRGWKKNISEEAGDLLGSMLSSDPRKRPTVDACLKHLWFAPLRDVRVPVHSRNSQWSGEVGALAACLSTPSTTSTASGSPSVSSASPFSSGDVVCNGDLSFEAFSREAVDSVEMRAMAGHFYHDIESTRGFQLEDHYCDISASSFATLSGSLGGYALQGSQGEDLYNACSDRGRHGLSPTAPLPRFLAVDLPPNAPQDQSFTFEPSTFHLPAVLVPDEIGNSLLNFLATEADASCTKVDRKKFAIRASVDGDAGSCALKVRVYAEDEGRYAIEFQRRSGDSLALDSIYRRAKAHFKL